MWWRWVVQKDQSHLSELQLIIFLVTAHPYMITRLKELIPFDWLGLSISGLLEWWCLFYVLWELWWTVLNLANDEWIWGLKAFTSACPKRNSQRGCVWVSNIFSGSRTSLVHPPRFPSLYDVEPLEGFRYWPWFSAMDRGIDCGVFEKMRPLDESIPETSVVVAAAQNCSAHL